MIKLSTLTQDQLADIQVLIDKQLNAGAGTDLGLEIKLAPSTLKDLIHTVKQVRDDSRELAESLIKTAFLEFFNQCPRVESIVWVQYAPYFNDGNPCIFSVDEPEAYAFKEHEDVDSDEEDDEDDEDDDGYEFGYGSRNIFHDESFNPETEIFENLLGSLFEGDAEDLMEHVFGSDSKVTASRDGFEVEEYDHD